MAKFNLRRHDQQIFCETIMFSVPGGVPVRASVPMEFKRTSVIRYAFSSRSTICTQGEAVNVRNIDVNADEGSCFIFTILISHEDRTYLKRN